jgi:hypothetical protein
MRAKASRESLDDLIPLHPAGGAIIISSPLTPPLRRT